MLLQLFSLFKWETKILKYVFQWLQWKIQKFLLLGFRLVFLMWDGESQLGNEIFDVGEHT